MRFEKFRLVAMFLSSLLLPFGAVYAEGNIKAGKAKAATCVACHGADGNITVDMWPKLAGQHEGYLVAQIKAIQEGEGGLRHEPTMYPMVKDLSEQDIMDLAAYYASLTIKHGVAQPEHVELGQLLYRAGIHEKGIPACAACHGPDGRGIGPFKFPAVAGQNMTYTLEQLKAYKTGERGTGPMMSDLVQNMSDEEMTAVASYIAGLH